MDKGFKVAGYLKHIGATPSPPAGIVCKHSKQHGYEHEYERCEDDIIKVVSGTS